MAAEKDNVDVQRLERKISEIEKILEESKPSKLKKGMILVEIDLIFEKLEEYCQLSGQSKTAVVERAVQKYLKKNLEKMREFSKQL